MPERIQRKRTKGWRMPANTVYVGRPTKWGNPYRVGLFGDFSVNTVDQAVDMYKQHLLFNDIGTQVSELKGKNLACWCPLDQPCHADVLLKVANDH